MGNRPSFDEIIDEPLGQYTFVVLFEILIFSNGKDGGTKWSVAPESKIDGDCVDVEILPIKLVIIHGEESCNFSFILCDCVY